MSIVEEYYVERKNSCVMHLRVGDVLIEITAYRGMFGEVVMRHRVLEEVEDYG